jgi:signal transduction histidine kinase
MSQDSSGSGAGQASDVGPRGAGDSTECGRKSASLEAFLVEPFSSRAELRCALDALVFRLLGVATLIEATVDETGLSFVAEVLRDREGRYVLCDGNRDSYSALCNRCPVANTEPLVIAPAHTDEILAQVDVGDRTPLGLYVAIPILDSARCVVGMVCGLDAAPIAPSREVLRTAQLLVRLDRIHADREQEARAEGIAIAARTAQHELNNCLAKLSIRAQLLLEEPTLPRPVRELAIGIQLSTTEGARILNRMADERPLRETDWGPMLDPTLRLD